MHIHNYNDVLHISYIRRTICICDCGLAFIFRRSLLVHCYTVHIELIHPSNDCIMCVKGSFPNLAGLNLLLWYISVMITLIGRNNEGNNSSTFHTSIATLTVYMDTKHLLSIFL